MYFENVLIVLFISSSVPICIRFNATSAASGPKYVKSSENAYTYVPEILIVPSLVSSSSETSKLHSKLPSSFSAILSV